MSSVVMCDVCGGRCETDPIRNLSLYGAICRRQVPAGWHEEVADICSAECLRLWGLDQGLPEVRGA